jgi:hypothetical protein
MYKTCALSTVHGNDDTSCYSENLQSMILELQYTIYDDVSQYTEYIQSRIHCIHTVNQFNYGGHLQNHGSHLQNQVSMNDNYYPILSLSTQQLFRCLIG